MICTECLEDKAIFKPDPRDSKGEYLVCKECADYIEYVAGEIQSGLQTQEEERLCL